MKIIMILAGLGLLLVQAAMLVVLVLCVSLLVSVPTAPAAAPAATATWHGWRATASVQACLDGQDAALLRTVYPDAVCRFRP